MNYKFIITTILACCLSFSAAFARIGVSDTPAVKKALAPVRRFYTGTSLDGAIFSTATIHNSGTSAAGNTADKMGTLRFTYAVNTGFTFNFNPGRHFGLYTGIDIKNIGFIEKNAGGETVKRRTYTLGVPIGIKIGNMADKKPYLFLGGGADAPFNYKEKSFSIRDQKTKMNEWFSMRTPAILPYVFAGIAINHGFTFKAQYYPNNFLNPDFTTNGVKPYAGYDVKLLLLSAGYAVPVKKNHGLIKNHKQITGV